MGPSKETVITVFGMVEQEEPEPFVRMQVQDVQVDDYIRRGAPDHFRRVKVVRPSRGGAVEIRYDDGATVIFGQLESVEVVRSGPSSPPGAVIALRRFIKSVPRDMSDEDVRQLVIDRAVELQIPDPDGMADAMIDLEAQSPLLKALGPLGIAVTIAKEVYRDNKALNPKWARPPARSNHWGLAEEAGGHSRPLTVELAPAATAVFERVRREIEFFGEDEGGDAGWGLNPWLMWDEERSRVAVNVGQVRIGDLSEPDSAELGSAVKRSSKPPVAFMWLNETGTIQTWIDV